MKTKITAEDLLNKSPLIEYAVYEAILEFDSDDDVETESWHFEYSIDEWLKDNQGEETDYDVLAQKWLDEIGYDRIRERIHYFG